MNKITLIGGIAIGTEIYGGEVIKNKILLRFLKGKIDDSRLTIIDTFEWQKHLFVVAFKILFVLLSRKHKIIILSCFTTGAYYFLKVYKVTSLLIKKDIYYFIVGGSLPDYLAVGKVKLKYYNEIQMFAESNHIREKLLRFGINNISVIPNWKGYNFTPVEKPRKKDFDKIKALSYSRICPEKGTDLTIEAVNRINAESVRIEVDFYGDIQSDYKKIFYDKISSKSYFDYKGRIDLTIDQNYSILANYDLMLFPTYYFGEGIPGAIIDCYIAGVPVLASDWNFNKDVIKHKETGLIFEAQNFDSFYKTLIYIIENKGLIEIMSKNCIETARNFKIDLLLNDFVLNLT
ncbi:MAG TPA: glycosyltransferase family 4 protein [Bacteroidales bacterium]|nr:glycosyltransferase family 4 protein [Bacteroidales bacterium]